MNTNRMKYASTPTYGMQKRGLFKKAPMRQAPEAPDFSKTPEPMPTFEPMPFAAPQQPAPVFPTMPPMAQSMPNASQPPFSAFIPPPMGAAPSMFQSMPPAFSTPISSAPVSPAPAGMGPSLRSQGFVPPQTNRPLVQAAAPMPFAQPSPFGGLPPITGQQPMPFAQGMVPPQGMMPGMAPNRMPPQGMIPPQSMMPPQSMSPGMVPPPNVPPQGAAFTPPVYPPQPGNVPPQQTAFTVRSVPAAKPPRTHAPLDADKLWTAFLFGLLPLLFIPCLFLSPAWDALRYVFIALTVLGLGGMWYRQMYASSTRLIVSMVYVALCIVTIVMTMQGGRDARLAGAQNGGQPPAAVQTTPPPADDPYAAMPVDPQPAPTPAPTVSGPSEAQRRLETFMRLWQVNNATEMVSLVQPSWASKQENPNTALFVLLANRTPEEFTIEEVSGTDQDNSRTVTMTALINKNNGKDPVLYRFMVIMAKEGDMWYVDPNSLATNDSEKPEENVVNNKSVAAATATPRYTVTPAPPASTTLYYNPNGGSFYHIDAYCPNVRSEYLPLTGTFSYAELKTYLNAPYNFKPCLKCGAPTSTLPDDN